MVYILLALLACVSIGIYLSIITERGRNTQTVLMLLLQARESGNDDFMQISFGKDPVALQKLLISMVKRGYLEQMVMVTVTRPQKTRVNAYYRLTRGGYLFAVQLRAALRQRRQ
jgi:hypothetical protein